MLSDRSKPPKQTVRDVRSVAHTVFGIEIDHRIVSVAQLDTNEADTPVGIVLPTADARVRMVRCTPTATAYVEMRAAGRRRPRLRRLLGGIGRNGRPPAARRVPRRSTRSASSSPQPTPCTSWLEIARIGSNRVAVVTVVYVEPPMELFVSGSAIVRKSATRPSSRRCSTPRIGGSAARRRGRATH